MKKRIGLTAAMVLMLTGCGMRDDKAETSKDTKPVTRTTAVSTTEVTGTKESVTEDTMVQSNVTDTEVDGSGILSDAESMIDEAGDKITSIVTEVSKELFGSR